MVINNKKYILFFYIVLFDLFMSRFMYLKLKRINMCIVITMFTNVLAILLSTIDFTQIESKTS